MHYVLVSLIKRKSVNQLQTRNVTSLVWNFVDPRFVVKNCLREFSLD
jgi:hypothetical protein